MTQAQRHSRMFKLSGVEKRMKSEGGYSYSVKLYPQRRNGWSDFDNVSMFIDGSEDQPKEHIFELLESTAPQTVLMLDIIPGGLRSDRAKTPKPGNGEFEHYFWNIERLTSVAEKPIGAGAVPSGDEGREEFERLGSAGQGGPGPGPWRGHQPGRGPVQGYVRPGASVDIDEAKHHGEVQRWRATGKVVVILDRQEGGGDLIRGRGYDFQSILTGKPPGVLEVTGKAL